MLELEIDLDKITDLDEREDVVDYMLYLAEMEKDFLLKERHHIHVVKECIKMSNMSFWRYWRENFPNNEINNG